jgi:hypothetical protein
MIVIVPNYVSDAINKKLDELLETCPDAINSRSHLYEQLLEYYNNNGELPDCSLAKNKPKE